MASRKDPDYLPAPGNPADCRVRICLRDFQWLRNSWPAGYSGVVNWGSRKMTLTVKVYCPTLSLSPDLVRIRKVSSRLSDSPGASSMGCRNDLHPLGVSSELHVGEAEASGRVYARTINGQLPTERRTGWSPLFATKARARTRSGPSGSRATDPVMLTPCASMGFTAHTGDSCVTWCTQPREAASKASGAREGMREWVATTKIWLGPSDPAHFPARRRLN